MSRSRPPKCRLGRNCGVCCYTSSAGSRHNKEKFRRHWYARVMSEEINICPEPRCQLERGHSGLHVCMGTEHESVFMDEWGSLEWHGMKAVV